MKGDRGGSYGDRGNKGGGFDGGKRERSPRGGDRNGYGVTSNPMPGYNQEG